jgi:hypothetical protein
LRKEDLMTIASRTDDLGPGPFDLSRFVGRSAFTPAIALAMHKTEPLYAEALREDGLLPGSLVATDTGWKPVERIQPGDIVLTFDNGAQRVSHVHQIVLPRDSIPPHKAFTMLVPMGALGNRRELRLLPCQEVIVESDMAEAEFGDPFVMIQALMLEGFFGIHRAPIEDDLRIYMVTFPAEQVIHIAGAALVTARPDSDFSPLSTMTLSETRTYPRLTLEQLRRIAASLKGVKCS